MGCCRLHLSISLEEKDNITEVDGTREEKLHNHYH